MPNLNKVMMMGHLTRDPQLSYLPSQMEVVDFGLATSHKYKKQDGTTVEDTCFVDCQMFGKRASVLQKYLHKGDPLFIEGRLKFESWQAQDGTKKSKHKVVVEEFQFIPRQEKSQQSEPAKPTAKNTEPIDEDIPF
jgi:single-strand DNA-binding protein